MVVERRPPGARLENPTPTSSDSPLARTIAEIWLQTLGPKLRGSEKHILRIGVGLRRIVRLLREIESQLGIKVPPTALLRLGTLSALTAAIESQSWPPSSPCVLLKEGDASPPLYIISAVNGLILELCELATLIDYPGPIFGVQPPGLDGEREPFTTVEELARCYHDAILARPSSGPYNLVGYSFGGLMAIETARLLSASGRQIGLLGLIDSNVEQKFWPKSVWFAGVAKRSLGRVAEALHLPPKQAVAHVATRAANLIAYIRRKIKGETTASINRSVYYIGGLEPDFQKVRDACLTAFEAYRPSRLELKATLFRSDLGDPHACDPVLVWRRLFRELEVVAIPGTHMSMVRQPHARVLAAAISARL